MRQRSKGEASATELAPRMRWALSLMPLRATDRVLEVGCGHGIALERVAAQVRSGWALGIDRSAKMTALARQRLAAAGLAERASVRTGALATVDLGHETFDVIFAINVSLFARAPATELERLIDRLAARGVVYLFYESPSPRHVREFADAAARHLQISGLRVVTLTRGNGAVCVAAARTPRQLAALRARPSEPS